MSWQRPQTPRAIRQLDQIARALAHTTSLNEVKTIRDQAEALRHYAHAASLGLKAQNRAAEVKLRAERRAGELLSKVVYHGGDRKGTSKTEATRLKELGIDHNQSARWQREAAVPEEVFERFLSAADQAGTEITAQALLRLERSILQAPSRRRREMSTIMDEEPMMPGSTWGESVFLFDMLTELQDHRRLLEQLLSPIWSGAVAQIKPAERRLAMRLLRDMEELLQRASKHCKSVLAQENARIGSMCCTLD